MKQMSYGMIVVGGMALVGWSQGAAAQTGDDSQYLHAAERTMAELTKDLEPTIHCFSHEEAYARYEVHVYETTDPNYQYVLKYSDNLADVAPAYRVVSSSFGGALYAKDEIRLTLRRNYGPEEIFLSDGSLVAKRRNYFHFELVEDFGVASANVSLARGSLTCAIKQ